jgi:creatinine amidohydrolase
MRCTAAEVQAAAARDALVIVPVASLEQHGPHLCTGTDILLGGAVALETARHLREAGREAIVTPVVWTGLAEHHMAFGGTVTLEGAAFLAVLRGVVRSTARHGFRRVMLLNGHGGNSEAIGMAVTELAAELGIHVAGGTYWHMAPEGVRPGRLAEAVGPASSRVPGQPPGLLMRRSFHEISETGVVGDARTASPEKGARLLDAIAARCAELLANPALWDMPPAEPRPGS